MTNKQRKQERRRFYRSDLKLVISFLEDRIEQFAIHLKYTHGLEWQEAGLIIDYLKQVAGVK